MTKTVQMQVTLAHPRASVWEKLTQTESINAWFAEQSHIAIPQQRYDFWGRFTPGTPSQAEGQRPILEQSDRHLVYQWTPSQDSKRIYYRLQDHPQGSVFIVQQQGLPENTEGFTACEEEDFWFLSLENLRRYLDGKSVTRCDFSHPMQGDIHHEISVEGSAEAVYQTLIRPDQLERWIASNAQVELVPGATSGTLDIGWGMAFKLLEAQPNQKISWEWVEGDKTTISTWTLSESDGKTRITFVHSGFAPTDPNEGLYTGWLNYLSRIQNIVEYGPSYVPPILQIAPNMAWIYAKSIVERQSELVI